MGKSYIPKQDDWDFYLGCLKAIHSATLREFTKLTPNRMMLGRGGGGG